MPSSPTLVDQPPPPPLSRGSSIISLYQACLDLTERFRDVPGFAQYLDPELLTSAQASGAASSPTSSTPNDPVNQLWMLFRLGTPLLCLLNGLRPEEPMDIETPGPNISNANAGKLAVYRFITSCRSDPQFLDDDMFTISELYQDNTNGFVKVIRVVSAMLDRMEAQGTIPARRSRRVSDPTPPGDNRAKVANEILETERSYVQDLESLQAYMRVLQNDGSIISSETIHLIFGNLNDLVDFQRRFLIAIEANAALPPQDQNMGQVFLLHEEMFSVYEVFCANFKDANELVVKEHEKLQRMNHILDAQHGISSILIKPVQRICKYPLLLHEMIKYTDQRHAHYQDLLDGEKAIKRVAENVNETNRRQENHAMALALQHKVAWKDGELVSDFGALLLHDTLLNPRGSPDKALEVYLFEKILVCCQNIATRKKPTKSLVRGGKPKPTLHLNGRIYINNIKSVYPTSSAGTYMLRVVWNLASEEFELRCRTEDQLKKWNGALERLVNEAKTERMAIPPSSSSNSSIIYTGISAAVNQVQSSFFRDDDIDLEDDFDGDELYDDPKSARGHSLPYAVTAHPGLINTRPRAKTEDGSLPPPASWNARMGGYTAHVTANGRPAPPGMSLPPLPRTSSSSSTAMGVNSPGEYPYSPPSSYPASPTVSNARGSGPNGPWQRKSQGDGQGPMQDTVSKFMSVDGCDDNRTQPLARNASAGYSYNTSSTSGTSLPPVPGPLRVRAQSSPNIHASGNPSWQKSNPELSTLHHRRPSDTSGPSSPSVLYPHGGHYIPAVPAIPSKHASPRMEHRPALRQQSSSSNLSIASGTTTPTAPPSQLRVKVNFQEDSYSIVVPMQIGYSELIERVEKKIRLCGCRRSESQPLRLRYKDEDNDYIIMKDDDDISLAIESCSPDGLMNLIVS